MKITNQNTGEQMEIADIDPAELGKFISKHMDDIHAAGTLAEASLVACSKRSALAAARIAMEISFLTEIPIEQATLIVLRVSEFNQSSTKAATDEFYREHIFREVERLENPGKHLKPV